MANKNTQNVIVNVGNKSSKPSKGTGKSKGTLIECAYCNGTGKDMKNIFGNGICRVCEGKGKVRA
jgi:DnaJ-class molecular chaperone